MSWNIRIHDTYKRRLEQQIMRLFSKSFGDIIGYTGNCIQNALEDNTISFMIQLKWNVDKNEVKIR